MSKNSYWSVAVFSSRESVATLRNTIQAIVAAVQGRRAVIDVIINGSNQSHLELCNSLHDSPLNISLCQLQVWHIEFADKAHAWNSYVHDIWQPSDVTFFVDGYVRPRADSFSILATTFDENQDVLCAAAVPTIGRSADILRKNMIKESGIHGNLYALSVTAMNAIRDIPFKLPIGIYRTDSTLRAAVSFKFHPEFYDWNRSLISVKQDATWDNDHLQWNQPTNLSTYLKRLARQARGDIENAAIRELVFIRRRPFTELPDNVYALVKDWNLSNRRLAWKILASNPHKLFAWHQFNPIEPSSGSLIPHRTC